MATAGHPSTKHPDSRQEAARAPIVGAAIWVHDPELHPGLELVLRRVQEAERSAVGAQRRPTFRLMREILGAAIRLGVPAQLLADCLGTSRQSVRNRASGLDGTLSAELIQRLTDLSPAQLDRLSGGELTRHTQRADQRAHATTDVVRALLGTPPIANDGFRPGVDAATPR